MEWDALGALKLFLVFGPLLGLATLELILLRRDRKRDAARRRAARPAAVPAETPRPG